MKRRVRLALCLRGIAAVLELEGKRCPGSGVGSEVRRNQHVARGARGDRELQVGIRCREGAGGIRQGGRLEKLLAGVDQAVAVGIVVEQHPLHVQGAGAGAHLIHPDVVDDDPILIGFELELSEHNRAGALFGFIRRLVDHGHRQRVRGVHDEAIVNVGGNGEGRCQPFGLLLGDYTRVFDRHVGLVRHREGHVHLGGDLSQRVDVQHNVQPLGGGARRTPRD